MHWIWSGYYYSCPRSTAPASCLESRYRTNSTANRAGGNELQNGLKRFMPIVRAHPPLDGKASTPIQDYEKDNQSPEGWTRLDPTDII